MTEEEARRWLSDHGWAGGAARDRLEQLAALVIVENDQQNLVSASTIPTFWSRHVVDSAQLLALAGAGDGLWVDLGSGGGFPGLVIACLREAPILLVETRGLRARFLQRCAEILNLPHVEVRQAKVERVALDVPASIISARAFASLDATFGMASHLCDQNTQWLLPKGRSAHLELETARQQWQAAFHVEQSVTDSESAIIVASGLRRTKSHGSVHPRSRKA